ncbi:hypothetical protein Gohar_008184 [Gossypium harknessii]|uniref:Uncharacterized protein n=1 Tax=Gossypium harknessii TaxID=34285 RepID=A0A7J9GIV4_9ROSI|nr:hypothetical protein [Gossypium harknessii]
MESIRIRKTKRKNTKTKTKRRKRVEINKKRRKEVITRRKRSFLVNLMVKMGRKPQMRRNFWKNLKVAVGRSLSRKRRVGIKIEAVFQVRRTLLGTFQVLTGRRSARIVIRLKILGILNLCRSWRGGSEMKVLELQANWQISLWVLTGKEMRDWSVLWLRLPTNRLKRKKSPREVMIGGSMCKGSRRRPELVEMLWFRTLLRQLKLKLKGSPNKWRIIPRSEGRGKKRLKKKKVIIKPRISAKIKTERRKVTAKIRIGTKRRRRRRRRKVNIGIWSWIT